MAEKEVVIIPAYNAEKTIGNILSQLKNYYTIVVDDGSIDNTFYEARKASHLISYSKNRGVGSAIKSAIDFAIKNKFTKAVTIDADGQHPVNKVNIVFQKLDNANFVIGNRFHAKNNLPDQKISSNLLGNIIFNNILKSKILDISCGFRGFRLERTITKIPSQSFDFLFEHLIYSLKRNYRIKYVNIPCNYYFNELLGAKYEETISFLSIMIKHLPNLRSKFSKSILELYQSVLSKKDFSIKFNGYNFHGFYVNSYQAYIIQTDVDKANSYFSEMRGKI